MMENVTHYLKDEAARRAVALIIQSLPLGTKVEIGEESRTQRQNRAVHGLIGQIMRQRPEHRGIRMSMEAYKAVFMHALGDELKMIPSLDGSGFVPVGLSTSALSVRRFNDLMEVIFAWCAREGLTVKHFDAARDLGSANNAPRRAA